ncbi:hypothetical protein [Tahibacter caeni]|uniref:hypothetical protein n=1 Tax=Tahibacter caeni TaxID=1453545 RepID=UPI002147F02F|nr:hypothetical protein [Tahibacter caeni]
MNGSGPDRTTPSVEDGDGVRVIRERRSMFSTATVVKVLAATLVVAGIATVVLSPRSSRTIVARGSDADAAPPAVTATLAAAEPPAVASTPATAAATRLPQHDAAAPAMSTTSRNPDDLPSGDPNDIATYVSPGEPAPTMTEVIQALHDLGDHTGIGAFNPPGTNPPLPGLAVPEDFDLPPGYVRHHQVTDEGEPLEPILMFSPDGKFVDASGREIAIPENRVVPPELAPPGLPIREIAITAAKRQP